MKKLSTGKRLLAFVCALVLTLGVGMQGNVITARAEEWDLFVIDANGDRIKTGTTNSYEERVDNQIKIYESTGNFTQEDLKPELFTPIVL